MTDGYGLAELVERSGLPARTLRWYQSGGLLPKPTTRGRDAVYTDEHLQRLQLIAELRERGLTLTAVRDLGGRARPARPARSRGRPRASSWLTKSSVPCVNLSTPARPRSNGNGVSYRRPGWQASRSK